MKRAVVLCIILLTGFRFSVYSQQTRLDSLLKANNAYQKEDSGKVLLLIDIYKEYRKLKQNKERFQYGEAATALGEKIKFTRPLPVIYNATALYYEGRSEYEKSIANYTRAIELSELAGDKENAAGYTLNYGTVYHTLADYPRALSLYQKAANYYISIGSEDDAALCFINMGGVYQEFAGQYVKAVEFINKALIIFLKSGDTGNRGVAEAYMSIANSYLSATDADLKQMNVDPAHKYQVCRQYADKAMNIAVISKEEDVRAEASSLAGKIEEMQGNYMAALEQYQVSLLIHQKANRPNYAYTAMLDIGRVYKKQNNFPGSLTYLRMALAGSRLIKVPDQQKDALLNISEVQEALHQYDSAYFYYRQYIVMRDSISNTEKQKEITRKVLQFEFGVKEREYQLNQQIADGKIKQQEGIAIRQQQEISLRNKQLELTKREKEIQKLNYLKKQSELENEQKLQAVKLNQKELERKLENRTAAQKISEQQSEISAERKRTFFLGLLAIILFSGAFFIYRGMQKTARLNKLVSAQKEELEEMGKVKDKIFSIVSHDMRAPVNNLVAFSSILEDGQIPQDKLVRYIDQIKGTLDHTSSMMENMLNWAASQMQGFTPVSEAVNLFPIIENVCKGMEPALQKKQITLHNNLSEKVSVTGDKNMIELIIRNLLSNAAKFTPQGGCIEVGIADKAGEICVQIKDNGIGLSEEKVKQINAASIRSLQSTAGTDKEKGTGLGLMLCKHFALLMKGKVSVESRKGSGSVFSLSLPKAG